MATEAVYNYMKTENKPHNLNDILTNLDNKYSRTMVQKAVDELVTDKKLFEKVDILIIQCIKGYKIFKKIISILILSLGLWQK